MAEDFSDAERYFRSVLRWMARVGHDATELIALTVDELLGGVTPTTPDTGTTSIAPSS